MTAIYKDPFEYALEELMKSSGRLKSQTIPVEEFLKSYRKLTIDSFLELLYSLFKLEGMLIDQDTPLGANTREKFIFTEVYPDTFDTTSTSNVVTFEIYQRVPTEYQSTAIRVNATTQYRPIYIAKVIDTDGKIAIYYEKHYTNTVKFTVWAEKSADARRLATALENFFTKNYHLLRMHVGHLLYEGRGPLISSNEHGSKRIFGIPLVFNIRTEEPGFLKKDDIVSIDTYSHVVDSLFLSDLEKINNKINK